MDFNEIRRRIEEFVGERVDKPLTQDPRFTERHDGPTPSGGDYSIAYYYDKDGHPCEKKQAASVNIIEFSKEGIRLNETYGLLG